MERRRQSEENDLDPIVWTNERVAKWCHSVDLGVRSHKCLDIDCTLEHILFATQALLIKSFLASKITCPSS